jgi:hypothetical protein
MSPAIAQAEYLERDEKLLTMPRAILHLLLSSSSGNIENAAFVALTLTVYQFVRVWKETCCNLLTNHGYFRAQSQQSPRTVY